MGTRQEAPSPQPSEPLPGARRDQRVQENTGQKIDLICLIFRPILKKQIPQKLKAFGNVFLLLL